jgi:hypothetical protein
VEVDPRGHDVGIRLVRGGLARPACSLNGTVVAEPIAEKGMREEVVAYPMGRGELGGPLADLGSTALVAQTQVRQRSREQPRWVVRLEPTGNLGMDQSTLSHAGLAQQRRRRGQVKFDGVGVLGKQGARADPWPPRLGRHRRGLRLGRPPPRGCSMARVRRYGLFPAR